MKRPFLRNPQHSGPEYIIRFTDYSGTHEERYHFASSAMFRYQQLRRFPGVRAAAWLMPNGNILQEFAE